MDATRIPRFAGPQTFARLPELLDGFQVPFDPFNLQFGRPELQHGGIAWLAPLSEPQALLDLHARLSDALLALGLTPEARTYRPHVTMARRANGAVVPAAGPAIDWAVTHYALVESRACSYTVLRQYR